MNGEERRTAIIQLLENSKKPVPGLEIAEKMKVSRQVIVQDIALIRASNREVFSTNRGYLMNPEKQCTRILKIIHTDDEVQKELECIVDVGGTVRDVFVYHKVYGILRADMNIRSRMDIANYMEGIRTGKSSLLKNVTSGYHYHTIVAESEKILDLIQTRLQEMGFLAKLRDYEPVDFWKNESLKSM